MDRTNSGLSLVGDYRFFCFLEKGQAREVGCSIRLQDEGVCFGDKEQCQRAPQRLVDGASGKGEGDYDTVAWNEDQEKAEDVLGYAEGVMCVSVGITVTRGGLYVVCVRGS